MSVFYARSLWIEEVGKSPALAILSHRQPVTGDAPGLLADRLPSHPKNRLTEICLTPMRFPPRISALKSGKQLAPYSARFDIRLVNRHAD
jgi:hypothetical protein